MKKKIPQEELVAVFDVEAKIVRDSKFSIVMRNLTCTFCCSLLRSLLLLPDKFVVTSTLCFIAYAMFLSAVFLAWRKSTWATLVGIHMAVSTCCHLTTVGKVQGYY
jgi:hypothetical protein